MNLFLISFISGAGFLLGFLLFFHPLQQNIKANCWLGVFASLIGCTFLNIYVSKTGIIVSDSFASKILNSLPFLMPSSLFMSVLYFVNPIKQFTKEDGLHFVPFLLYSCVENGFHISQNSLSEFPLFPITNDVSFLVRDILPFLLLFYLTKSYVLLLKHQENLKQISSSVDEINLDWLIQFLYLMLVIVIVWINDAFFELPLLTEATNLLYAGLLFFLAYFSIRQKNIFTFKEKEIQEISELISPEHHKSEPKPKRINDDQTAALSIRLMSLVEKDKIFLDNELTLPIVAEKLNISIHDASFLINETTGDNFYNFINKHRVEEAKKLLVSEQANQLNMLGIAFASGFNSKTTFNTAFKKQTGVSPSSYVKSQKL